LGDDIADAIAAAGRGEKYQDPWSTGTRNHDIVMGDRAYLLRQGRSDRGIVAVGQFASEIVWDKHWDRLWP
jgi:hypothetical protein